MHGHTEVRSTGRSWIQRVSDTTCCLQARLPESERYFGLENFGNTCYANSVLQVQSAMV